MINPTVTTINTIAFNGFESIREKLFNLHSMQFVAEGVKLRPDLKALTKIAVYHLCLCYALLLRVETQDPLFTGDEESWKNDHDYASLKKCAASYKIDLDSIITNTST